MGRQSHPVISGVILNRLNRAVHVGTSGGQMLQLQYKFKVLFGMIAVLLFLLIPHQAQAQWPPFKFRLLSAYADGKITYTLEFSPQVDWSMADVVIKIPLPEGTHFVQAGAPSTTATNFDGAEITFFSPTLHKLLKDAYFVVEVANPDQTEFAAHAWIAWKGDVPGDYLTGDSVIDITRTPLKFERPLSRLRLEAGAVVNGDVITYLLYPTNIGGRRMWDVSISLPLPPGTTFVSAEAAPPFVAAFDGQQAVFTISELERHTAVEPLRVQVLATGVTTPFLTTHATAGWTNVGRQVVPQEYTETGDIIVQPHINQYVVADRVGDTPFPNYDLTGIAFQRDGEAVKTTFYTAEAMGPVGSPLEYYLYLDTDCNTGTGKPRGNRGAEYWVRYRHQNGGGYLYTWDPAASRWINRQQIPSVGNSGNAASVWLPATVMPAESPLCWLALSRNRTGQYHPNPPIDWMGHEPRLTAGIFLP